MKGVIITIIPNRGYGFIRGDRDGTTRFMHANNVLNIRDFDHMYEGQRVSFVPVDGPEAEGHNGLRATKIKPEIIKE